MRAERPKEPRVWLIRYIRRDGQTAFSGPFTRAGAEQRLRATQWSAGSIPRIVRTNAKGV
jgi:hypothetical protein